MHDKNSKLQSVAEAYNLPGASVAIIPFGSGLINHTWMIDAGNEQKFILQKLNQTIFKSPEAIAQNISCISNYLQQHHPDYLFVTPKNTKNRKELFFLEGEGYFRLFPFVENSHTVDVVTEPSQAYEAARQFGKFTRLLSNFDTTQLHITLPDFHNLPLRFTQFTQAWKNADPEKKETASEIANYLLRQQSIVDTSVSIQTNAAFKKRVTHHDTKISNVLFDAEEKAICVIDLDTVMPGYFISDAGDMMRTYLSPVSEEEKDFSKIEIRPAFFKAIADGYLREMNDELSAEEKAHFVYAGKFMIYMQALRFLTDYLNNDVYYGARYDGHNFVRACNQVVLLQKLTENEQELVQMIP